MAQSQNRKVVFSAGKQRAFIEQALEKKSVPELAYISKCSERTIREWRREKYLVPENIVRSMCKKLNLSFPKGVTFRDQYWYTSKGAKKGGYASLRAQGGAIGNPEKRQRAWKAWWERVGKFEKRLIHQKIPIHKPRVSAELAEFCGIMLGDGGISHRQVTVTLHSVDDAPYGQFVMKLTQKLFGVALVRRKRKDANAHSYVISRTELVEFLTQELGLVQGDKIRQCIDIPLWIQKDPDLLVACVRGLVDTDGCIFTHSYRVQRKWYSYKKLSFTSASPPLINSVYSLFRSLGMRPYIGQRGRDVRLNSVADMRQYFARIGTNNPKHLRRYAS